MKQPDWLKNLKKFEKPELNKSVKQLISTFVPFAALLTGMFISISIGLPYWLVLLMGFITSMFMVRIFIILHDCSHGSFFRSKRACNILGNICGYITFMSYDEFRHSHIIHHATTAKLDKRGIGDVWTLTVGEYLAASTFKKFMYRNFRSPYMFLIFGPLLRFFIINRIPSKSTKGKELTNIILLDIFIPLTLVIAYFTVGVWNYVLVMAPILFIVQDIGILLFFIQHQFEDVYWSDSKNWDPLKAAMQGSSYYKLPIVLQWITGHIGLHHIHHLHPGIPNYKLNQCFKEVPELQEVKPVKMFQGIKGLSFKLWDERNNSLVKVSALRNSG
ncbi:MAG: fatty acid desaturase family protein [Ignavibacteria bacterium]|nr:fatty acid desaturase family protein [Ignavibacteria bacterium]